MSISIILISIIVDRRSCWLVLLGTHQGVHLSLKLGVLAVQIIKLLLKGFLLHLFILTTLRHSIFVIFHCSIISLYCWSFNMAHRPEAAKVSLKEHGAEGEVVVNHVKQVSVQRHADAIGAPIKVTRDD